MYSFMWLCVITSTKFLLLQQLIMQYDVCKVLCAYQTNINISTKEWDTEKLWKMFLYHLKSSFK